MANLTNSRDLILQLREVKDARNLKISEIYDMVDEKISKSTLSRIFAVGSEDTTFRYETIIKPLAEVLLDIETIEEDDSKAVRAMKTLLKYKSERISELEQKIAELETMLDKQKIRANEKLEKERENYQNSISFLKQQVELKDKRMDLLLDAVFEKDKLHKEMLEKIIRCSKCDKYED